MEEVEVAVALGAVIVVVVIVSLLFRKRGTREAQSVADYRQTLDVLGHVSAERGVRPQASDPEAPRAVPFEAPRQPATSHVVDAGRRRRTGAPGGAPATRDRSLLVMERPARRLGVPLAVLVLVLALCGGAAYLGVRARHPAHPSKQATRSHAHRHTTTPTTAQASYAAVSSTSSSATYAPATSAYSLTIGATTADCWISVTSASGTTVLEQTFAPGASASVSLTGNSTILLGAPRAAKISIDGVPVVLPSGIQGPFTVTLSPA